MLDNNHLKCTKIVCTIGPASNTKAMITALLDAGMNILRLNFSHGTYEEHEKLFDIIDEIRKEGKYIFGVALDTKGPEIRAIMNDKIDVKKGDQLKFTSKKSGEHIQIENVDFNDVKKDYEFTLDDGLLRVKVVDVNKLIVTEALNSHILKPNKSVNLPGIKLKIPFLSKKDKDDILFGVKHKVDYIFASFVSNPEDIQDIKNLIGNDQQCAMIIAKIESFDGVKYVDEIIKAADGIMVARGDLGAELPFEELHAAQKKITGKCKKHGKPVIIATQMLENMINCPVPKRCEITDIGNAVHDFADCIMLSAESATGERPVECVKMMSNIARVTETIQANKRPKKIKDSSIASAIKVLSTDKQVKAIVIISDCIADIIRIYKRQKHVKPIIVAMTNSSDMQRLTMYRNIVPFKFVLDQNKRSDERLEQLMECIKKKYELSSSDSVVIYRKDQKKHGIITVAKLA